MYVRFQEQATAGSRESGCRYSITEYHVAPPTQMQHRCRGLAGETAIPRRNSPSGSVRLFGYGNGDP